MQYLLANNRSYTTEHLLKLQVQKDDTIIVCNFFFLDKLPKWDVKYLYFIRNVFDKKDITIKMIEYLKPEKIYFVSDPGGMDLEFAQSLNISFEDLPAKTENYPMGAPSTGFVAAILFPDANLVGFQDALYYNGCDWHDFIYEHKFIKNYRKIILL